MYFLYALIAAALFQESALGAIGASGPTLFFLRASVDILFVVVFIYALLRSVTEKSVWRLSGTGYEKVFFLFFIYSIFISAVAVKSNLGVNAAEILVLNRFVFLALIIPMIVNSERRIARLQNFIWIMILIQALIGLAQQIGGQAVLSMFTPSDYSNVLSGSDRSFTSGRGYERKMLIGTVGDFISFGYVLAFGVLMQLSKKRLSTKVVLSVLALLLMIFLTGSRTIFLCVTLTLIGYTFFSLSQKGRLIFSVGALISLSPLLLVLYKIASQTDYTGTSFLALFRPEFIEVLMTQRLGHALLYFPEFLFDPNVIFGLSPDKYFAANYASTTYGDVLPYVFLATFAETLEDFYPVALVTYYGIVGSGLFYLFHYKIFSAAWQDRDSEDQTLSIASRQVLFGLALAHFFSLGNQSFENRSWALLLWISVGVYVSARRISEKTSHEKFSIQNDSSASLRTL